MQGGNRPLYTASDSIPARNNSTLCVTHKLLFRICEPICICMFVNGPRYNKKSYCTYKKYLQSAICHRKKQES